MSRALARKFEIYNIILIYNLNEMKMEYSLYTQAKYRGKLKEFNLEESRPSIIPMDPGSLKRQEIHTDVKDKEAYRRAMGSLLYLATNTRPGIAVGTSILARHVSDSTEADCVEVKRLFRYLKHTKQMKMKLGNTEEQQSNSLTVFVDADWGGDVEDRESSSGYFFRYLGATVAWTSRKQSMITLSSTEAKYIALAEALQEAVWIRRLLADLDQNISGPTVIFEDNQNCIRLLKNDKSSSRTKHIDIKYHFVRDLYRSGDTDVKNCPSEQMTANLLTKPLEAVKTRQFVVNIGFV